ncbi:hypothetical protein TGAM01_v208971 [Trichoderma gamsii]|uniref:Uncharacterized protein n=1 Tax=Trichoderma gamsii TaxID=398673 RepID=A0A2P4ZCS2_9HYPO|nr:hypothetical protein TGAM01_v208971 [Trichoderma gamsii]PON22097.1 hypothetical protein TGAM01_v208971 [Trichoderma gamsii]
MLFKSTLLLPALLALSLATAVPGPDVEEDLAARGAEFGDNVEDLAARGAEFGDNVEDLAARDRSPDCGRFASYNSKQHLLSEGLFLRPPFTQMLPKARLRFQAFEVSLNDIVSLDGSAETKSKMDTSATRVNFRPNNIHYFTLK